MSITVRDGFGGTREGWGNPQEGQCSICGFYTSLKSRGGVCIEYKPDAGGGRKAATGRLCPDCTRSVIATAQDSTYIWAQNYAHHEYR